MGFRSARLIGAAFLLFSMTFGLPRLLQRERPNEVAFEVRPVREPSAGDPSDASGSKEAKRVVHFDYESGGYPFLWVVQIRSRDDIEPLIPRSAIGTGRFGQPLSASRGSLSSEHLVWDGSTPAVVLAQFSPVPLTLDDIRTAARTVGRVDAETVARELVLPGRRFVRLLQAD